jgi:hypothetical protein
MENVSRKKILGRSVIIRKRKHLSKPVAYSKGKCFHQFDSGLYTIYVELDKPSKAIYFGSIDDRG